MNISEKVAYLKGLAKGLDIDTDSKEGKLFDVVLDILDDIAANLGEIEDNALDLGDEIDQLSGDLAVLEDIVYDENEGDEDEDEEDEDCDCSCEDGCACGCGGEDDEFPLFFEVTCPSCENTITIDEDVLNLGTIQCPNCGEMLEFDLDAIEEEDPDKDKDKDVE